MTAKLVIRILIASLAYAPTLANSAEPRPAVRVMSFNIRYGTARDGDNSWTKRQDFLVETIRAFDPDLLGTQETLDFQRDYIAGQRFHPDWTRVGGLMRDLPDEETFKTMVKNFIRERLPNAIKDIETLLNTNRIFIDNSRDPAPRIVDHLATRLRQPSAATS